MKLIIVPGNSQAQKEWSEKAKEAVGDFFEETKVLSYSHWETSEPIINFDLELNKLASLSEGMGDYVVVAKSAGTLLTMRAVSEGKIFPKKCLFLGVPIKWAEYHKFEVKEWIQNFHVQTLVIQQESDVTCSAQELEVAFNELSVADFKMNSIPGGDHSYSDWDFLRSEVKAFL